MHLKQKGFGCSGGSLSLQFPHRLERVEDFTGRLATSRAIASSPEKKTKHTGIHCESQRRRVGVPSPSKPPKAGQTHPLWSLPWPQTLQVSPSHVPCYFQSLPGGAAYRNAEETWAPVPCGFLYPLYAGCNSPPPSCRRQEVILDLRSLPAAAPPTPSS